MCAFGQVVQADIPEVAKVPKMEFDQLLLNKVISADEDNLPLYYKVDKLTIVLGKTSLVDVTNALKTGIPHYDGNGYFQCYSIPRYSHQIWFATEGRDLFVPIIEITIVKGERLPTDYCPLITSATYPVFSSKMRLGLDRDQLMALLGLPLEEDESSNTIHLFNLPKYKRLRVQTHLGRTGVDKIKVKQESLETISSVTR